MLESLKKYLYFWGFELVYYHFLVKDLQNCIFAEELIVGFPCFAKFSRMFEARDTN